jgi:hypothetical protein
VPHRERVVANIGQKIYLSASYGWLSCDSWTIARASSHHTLGSRPTNLNLVLPYNHNDSDAKKRNRVVDKGDADMNDCTIMELQCLERAKVDQLNRGRWIAQAERWHELARVQSSWRLQKKPLQQAMMHAGPMATQPRQQS